jgi:hypothetical protein
VRTPLRAGLGALALVELVLGLWTLLFPASSYDDVPTGPDATGPCRRRSCS